MTRIAMYEGDCLEVLRGFRAGSVDLCITSPPYEAARTYGIGFKLRGRDYIRWAADRFMECLRVTRGVVVWVIEGQTRGYEWSAAPMELAVELRRRGAVLRKPPVFYRIGIPGSGGPDYFRNDYEFCIVATARKGKLPWSDNTACGHPPKWGPGGEMSNRVSDGTRVNQWGKTVGQSDQPTAKARKADGTRDARRRPSHVAITMRVARGVGPTGEQLPNHTKPFPKIANPGNVIRCSVGGGSMGDRLCHENEAPFPEALAERFIRSFCPPGGVVLDCFGGSGTVGKVAAMHGRNAVLIDIRAGKGGLDTARRRIEAFNAANPDKAARIVWPNRRATA